MPDILIRTIGKAGRITLNRPDALNALTPEMGLSIEAAIDSWSDDDAVSMVIIDAEGDRAFCAGGDIAMIYEAGVAGDYSVARQFWREEYRLNEKLFNFPKPVASFLQGFTMGGGVGIGCHASHRVVCENSKIAMPECGIGLVPDVGGSLLLARAPGRCGEYLGTTAARMGPGDAIYAGFADYFIPRENWSDLIDKLEVTGDWTQIDAMAGFPPAGELADMQDQIDWCFGGEALIDIMNVLRSEASDFAAASLTALGRVSPLSAAIAVELIHRVRARDDIRAALELEFRATYRGIEDGDFLEGIRAQVIDKDRKPAWKHESPDRVTPVEVSRMLMPLKELALKLED